MQKKKKQTNKTKDGETRKRHPQMRGNIWCFDKFDLLFAGQASCPLQRVNKTLHV